MSLCRFPAGTIHRCRAGYWAAVKGRTILRRGTLPYDTWGDLRARLASLGFHFGRTPFLTSDTSGRDERKNRMTHEELYRLAEEAAVSLARGDEFDHARAIRELVTQHKAQSAALARQYADAVLGDKGPPVDGEGDEL